MSSKTISTHVTTTVILGSGGYGDTLTLTSTADLAPIAAGADGIIAPASLSGVQITNDGSIVAGSGDANVAGGIGVDLLSAGTLINRGIIEGGYGGTLGLPLGGAGVFLDRLGTLTNVGTIMGGNANFGGFAGTGVYIDGGTVTNSGVITGGAAEADGSTGGDGVKLGAGGTLSNSGTISGGSGGDIVLSASGGDGGVGVDIFSGADLTNNGTIIGGVAAYAAFGTIGVPGAGVFLAAGGTIINNRLIEGGSAGYGSNVAGAAGVEIAAAGTLINHGTITGGYGGTPSFALGAGNSPGGDGVDVVSFGVISNGGTITGGHGGPEFSYEGTGGIGVYLHAGTLTNGGLIQGGAAGVLANFIPEYGPIGNAGGTGVSLASNGTITNSGTIIGGKGSPDLTKGYNGGPNGGVGGMGVDIGQGGTLVNRGLIVGGAGGYSVGDRSYGAGNGGIGVAVAGGGNAFVNHGIITGGAGGSEQNPQSGAPGAGGTGADIDTFGPSSNTGVITGGAGGASASIYGPPLGTGGAGGTGVYLASGTLTNTGDITGGAGGYGLIQGGVGGAGVYLDYGTLVTSGTISGGAGGNGNLANGAAGDAVKFAPGDPSYAATLVIDPGAVFNGVVAASASANDVLQLAGSAAGTIGDLGIDFTSFSTITETAGANWTLDRLNELAAATSLQVDGRLSVTGTLIANGPVIVGPNGNLVAAAGGAIEIPAELTLQGGTVSGPGTFSLGPEPGYGLGGTLSGFGTVTNASAYYESSVVAEGGTLSLQGPYIAPVGAPFLIDSKAALQIEGGGSLGDVVFASTGQAHLILSGGINNPIDATLTGFGTGDAIDLSGLTASLADFQNGVMVVPDGLYNEVLTFAGGVTAANLRFASDGHGGTDVTFAPTSGANPAGTASAAGPHSSPQGHAPGLLLCEMLWDHWHL